MPWKNLAQASLSDALVKHHAALKELDGIHRLIDWKPIEEQMSDIHAKRASVAAVVDVLGTPLRCSCIALPPASMQSKALLLQSWNGLRDPGLKKQLSAKGLYIKTGEVSIVYATVIEAKQRRTTSTSMKSASSKPLNTPPATNMTRSPSKNC